MSDTRQDWAVDIQEEGRCGRVNYRDPAGRLSFYWEFGGADAVALIQVGDAETWRQQHAWALPRRGEILRRVAAEVIRQQAPNCRAEVDDRQGWITLYQVTSPPPPPSKPSDANMYFRLSALKARFAAIAGVVILAGGLLVWGVQKALSIRVPHGSPMGLSARSGDQIATLIQTLEAYVPSLHRDPAKDRYRISLFLWPVDGTTAGRLIPLAKERPAQSQGIELLGGDGRWVWFELDGIGAVDVATGQRIGAAELRAANPALAESWDDPRRIGFQQRLRLTLPDRTVLEVDPRTLQTSPAPAPVKASSAPMPLSPEVGHFLCAGVQPAPAQWLGLHSQTEAQRDFKPRAWLTRSNRQEDAKVMRRLYRGELGAELPSGHRPILSMTPLSEQEYLNAAFVRAGLLAEPLRLAGPDGYLMIHTSAPGLAGTLVVARVDPRGNLVWTADTGIDRFKLTQILPDPRHVAFIGTRPAAAGQVPEPVLVSVDTQSGALSRTTLWQ